MILSSVFLSPKKTITTQKRNNQKYDQSLVEYQREVERAAQLSNSHPINVHEITNGLRLNDENGIHGQIEYLSPNAGLASGSDYAFQGLPPAPNAVSKGAYYNSNVPGDFIRVTYTGFGADDTYTDPSGQVHHINKLTVTFSNLQTLGNGKASFIVALGAGGEGRIWNGVDSLNVVSYYQTINFYDDKGKPIEFAPGTAWLPVGSLSHWKDGHTEKIKVINGGKIFALVGGNATVHPDSGDLYQDEVSGVNPDGTDTVNVLGTDGGCGVIELSNGITVNPHITTGSGQNSEWNYFVDNSTSLIGDKTLVPPIRELTSTHYHYNTAIVTPPTQPTHETVHYHYDAYNYTPNAQKHFVDHGQISDNKVYADGSAITAQIDSTLPDAANFPDGLKSVVLDEDYSNYAKYVTSGDVSKVKITDLSNNSDVTNDFTITDDGQGHMTITLKDPSKAKGQTIRVTPSWTINKDVADQTALKNVAMLVVNGVKGDPATATVTTYNAKPHKDVELGDNVQGDTPNSIAGQTVPAGTVVTFPLSSNDLPANREQDVVTVVWSDTLDDNLDYQSYKAYLPDANGQLTDVTDHVKLDQNGKNLKFTWDDYLIQLANENKASAFKKPVIDLVAKVNGNSIVATNKFDEAMTFKDLTGNQTNVDVTSNEVSVKTPDAPKPQKEDLNDQGQNIDGQEVTAGQHITYQLDWNFINDKGITASTGDIAKGFFFADPIDSNALEAGDLSTAQVIDENGNKVSGVSIKLYNSLSEAPELFQQEVKENGLTDKFSHGPFFLASADNPQDFFTKYVSAGKSLKVDIPTVVKDGYNGTFSNTAWQFEFGKATPTNTVTNTVKPSPKPAPTPVSTPRPASPAPAAPAAPQAALPQTGNNNNTAVIGLAIAGLAASMSLAGLGLRKKN